MAQLEAFTPTGDAEIDSQWRGRLQQRFAEVANQMRAKTAELSKITSHQQAPRRLNTALLDRVPVIEFDLFDLPEEHQRRLFDAFHRTAVQPFPSPTHREGHAVRGDRRCVAASHTEARRCAR